MTSSTKPYMIRALHEWCTDSGYTPYIVVWVSEHTDVPREYVQKNEIVLNVSYQATQHMQISNDAISFAARFGGVSRPVYVPIGNVMSIFARETGEGMGFEVEPLPESALKGPVPFNPAVAKSSAREEGEEGEEGVDRPRPSGKPSLRIVK
ncbi:ClpXP protease specificity-enhancing factor [Paludibacterium paludis]|uniref:Stringent starvation protein B n=1 Tax=Paludibacterium paludis TaxID=1225769 RepID=A0A918U7T0_9NEIS|nr:ClpXP protease specificity-enhancing factor [Paludibacterium paludis]GGY08325.1 hypothetical protein GCM10011289_08800 [Paludibacterium paludis]